MYIYRHPEFNDHEQIIFFRLQRSGLYGILAIHKTFFHPVLKSPSALGGARMKPYENTDDALTDVLRLSRSMTKKAALAETDFGGAKMVIIGDPKKDKTPDMLDDLADVLNSWSGLYVIAEDMGITEKDMNYLFQRTRWVSGKSKEAGGSGNPGPVTALGVFEGLQACLKYKYDTLNMRGKRFAISGLGNVGHSLAIFIAEAGGNLLLADIDKTALSRTIEEVKKTPGCFEVDPFEVDPAEIHKIKVSAYCPCANGAVINDDTIAELNCDIVAGSANNQLATQEHGDILYERGITYAPDFIINAGGLINAASELNRERYNEQAALMHVRRISGRLHHIFLESDNRNISPTRIADEMAGKIIEQKVQECSEKLREQYTRSPI
ncbi:hypothetical protein CL630_03875 [bacterium]|nr:hypothetical protein [bacterium]|tara:strand:+ start:56276 stop:57418 length:1143 start_codon:yes stop_codon:yes gene_type:complete